MKTLVNYKVKMFLGLGMAIASIVTVGARAQEAVIEEDSVEESSDLTGTITGDQGYDHGGLNDNGPGLLCGRYDRNPSVCSQIRGCVFDYRDNRCEPDRRLPAPSYCSSYNYNYNECVRLGCLFDGQSGACYSNNNYPTPIPPRPYPQPNPQPYPPRPYPQPIPQPYPQPFPPQPYPQPYPQPFPPTSRGFSCVAVDSGFEEHRGGHVAFGLTQLAAQQSAMATCLQLHGNCRISQCRAQ